MMRILFILLFLSQSVFAATLWVNPSGSATSPYDTKEKGLTTIVAGIDAMSGGDTLIIADGTYTGSSNMIGAYSGSGRPPEGSSSAYTTIKAETTGSVIIDGGGTYRPILLRGDDRNWATESDTGDSTSEDYIKLEGLIAKNSGYGVVTVYYVNHIKLIDIGAYDAADGNSMGFELGSVVDFLLEGCYAWGSGRYMFDPGASLQGIVRNCVARQDRVDGDTVTEPMGTFVAYGSKDIIFQNCIAIDGDDYSHFHNYEQQQGLFGAPGTSARYFDDMTGETIRFQQCIGLNNAQRWSTSDAGEYYNRLYFDNSVAWDITLPPGSSSVTYTVPAVVSAGDTTINQTTFGDITAYDGLQIGGSHDKAVIDGYSNHSGNTDTATNSVFYNLKDGHCFGEWEESNYNNVYGLESGMSVDRAGSSTSTNVITTDPSYTYIVKRPSGLEGAGLSGVDVGANIMYQMGKTGSMWGETGYNLLQDGTNGQATVELWPFPNEDLIKSKMQAYTYDDSAFSAGTISGNRGFASSTAKQLDGTTDVTLTSYIWEYLGNEMPDDIYDNDNGGSPLGGNSHMLNIGSGGSTINFN